MNRKDKNLQNAEDRKGFWRIGYLENQDYGKRMMELTRRQMEVAEVDELIDKVVDNHKGTYLAVDFIETTEENAVYALFFTGMKGYHQNKEIAGGFYRREPSDQWKGVYLEHNLELLKETLFNERQRSALEDYTYIYDYTHITRVCKEAFPTHRPEEEWANYIGSIFTQRQEAGEIYTFTTGSYFVAEETSKNGDTMYFWMERNDKPGAKQKGFGLNVVTEEDLLEMWSEAQYKYTLDRLIFESYEDLEDFVEEVAQTAMPENWGRLNNTNPELSYGHPVLKSYIEYTLIRLRHLDKKTTGYLLREDERIYYNTGLLNKFFRQILVGAKLQTKMHSVPGLGDRIFEYYFDPYTIVSGHDTKFPTENGLLDFPKLATYFEKKEDVLYDASLEIMLNDEHIFEDGLKAGRIPIFKEEYAQIKHNIEEVKSLHVRVQARVQTAIQRARLLAERNYKLAVPQYWKDAGEVQFLLPLYMEETEYTGRPQCALALRRAKNGGYYEGATILSLDMAYNNARLIAKPDVTWLNRGVCTDDFGILQVSCPISSVVNRAMAEQETFAPAIAKKEETDSPEESPQLAVATDDGEEVVAEGEPIDENKVGTTVILEKIVSRPSGKGLRGELLGTTGTVARSLLKNSVPYYTGGRLKVKIVGVNPQGNQYILEPVE